MASLLYLCQMPEIDSSYEHVIDFNSRDSRLSYFSKRVKRVLDFDFKGDAFRNQLTIPASLDEIRETDYCYFLGDDRNYYFYFIDSKSYKTQDTANIEMTLDVFTTYQFDFKFMSSFVERCHVDRFTSNGLPTYEVVDEGFNYSNYVQVDRQEITEYGNNYIMTASEPLGYMVPSGVGGGGQTNGLITKQGFRFIKGYEAFTPTGLYLNGESFRTVGYGSTELHNKSYYDLHKPFPVSEKRASELFAERIANEFAPALYSALEKAGVIQQITKNMFDAMLSLSYNRGINGFMTDPTSPYHLIKVNPLNFDHIRRVWEGYAVTSAETGEVLSGLVKRRKAESDIYCLSKYEMREISIYKDNGSGVGIYGGVLTDNEGNGYIPPNLPDVNDKSESNYTLTDEEGNTWQTPTTGEISAGYPDYPPSFNNGGFHGGIDFKNEKGTPIRASGSGTVAVVDRYQGDKNEQPYGNLIIINQAGNKTGNMYKVYYAHLDTVSVKDGDTVLKGQQIGTMGTTGNSTGNHLHYEMRKSPYSPQKATTIDPAVGLKVGMTIKGGGTND